MVEVCSEILPYQKKPKMESFLEPTNSLNSKRKTTLLIAILNANEAVSL
jgi:hypothetical protein